LDGSLTLPWHDFRGQRQTASTIVDGGGIDTLDFSGYIQAQKIDLTVQYANQTYQNTSDIGGRVGNLTLAVQTVIENVIGGSGDDRLIGNWANNVLEGRGGNDTLYGGGGTDIALFNPIFGSYSFSILQNAIEVIGEGTDRVHGSIETLAFSNVTYSHTDFVSLLSASEPVAQNDTARIEKGTPLVLDVLGNDAGQNANGLAIIEVNGQASDAGGAVRLASGASVRLTAEGTLTLSPKWRFRRSLRWLEWNR